MAESWLGFVTENLISKVISLAKDRISEVLGVKEDLQKLVEQLELIRALLSDAKNISTTPSVIARWLRRLEDASSLADDLLDEFAHEVLRKKMQKGKMDKVRSFFSSSNSILFRSRMASKIKKINLQMDKVFKTAEKIGLRPVEILNSPSDLIKVPLTLTGSFVDDSKIVGRDEEVSELVGKLTCSKNENNLSVMGIVGIDGQGKTTLAQLLMNNDEVKKHFEERVWTCVLDDFNVVRVLNDMLQSLTEEALQFTNVDAIVRRLSTELQGKRFLLVLEDLRDKDFKNWDYMNKSLQAIGGSKGSMIIVTTQDEVVVKNMGGFVHHLANLSDEACEELFEKIAFTNGSVEKSPDLVNIGKRIFRMCGGMPLALKTMGGLLSSQTDAREWQKIEKSIWRTLDGVRSSIMLSFNNLSSPSLMLCFIYCSTFPKGSVIKRKVLIQQWMAHGLLNPSEGSDSEMEDTGNKYFEVLLQISLLQKAEIDECGNIIGCKMHNLVHDFAFEISRGHCLTAKVGDLCDDGSNNLNVSKKKFSKLRTLHLPDDSSDKNFLAHGKCKHLRVLTLVDVEMKELPNSIAKMKHLRYLDISRTSIHALPKFISKLYHLQTLRLPFVQNFPKNFVKLVNLRHLYINEEVVVIDFPRPPLVPGIGQIENVANGDDAREANLSGKRNIESLDLALSLTNNREGSSNNESVLDGLQPDVCLKYPTIARLENVANGDDARGVQGAGCRLY